MLILPGPTYYLMEISYPDSHLDAFGAGSYTKALYYIMLQRLSPSKMFRVKGCRETTFGESLSRHMRQPTYLISNNALL